MPQTRLPDSHELVVVGMTRFRRSFILILFAQAICLIVGLWINHKLIAAFSNNEFANLQNNHITSDPKTTGPDNHPAEEATGYLLSGQAKSKPNFDTSATQLAANAFTSIWVVSLQGVLIYFVLNRVESEHDTENQKHYHESLTKTRDLLQTRDAIIFGLAQLAESRDSDTGQHLERIALYSTRLASAVRHDPRFQNRVSPSFVRLIGISSALHDIGKVSIADSVLLKPGPLTDDERFEMETHAQRGAECIEKIETRLGQCNFLQMAREIASSHHEKWDGTGYPARLRGEEIPLSARIVSIADVYDALRSKRTYKNTMSHETAVEIIESGSGTQFDPALIEIFLKIQFQFFEISEAFANGKAPVENLELQNV